MYCVCQRCPSCNHSQLLCTCIQDYLSWTGDWQAAPGEQASGYNEALAELIAEGVMAEVATRKTEREVPDVPLRLALVGAPFSGKTTMARKLAEEYGCKVSTLTATQHLDLANTVSWAAVLPLDTFVQQPSVATWRLYMGAVSCPVLCITAGLTHILALHLACQPACFWQDV